MTETKKEPSLLFNIAKLGIVLLAVSAAVALVLGLVNQLTAGRIESLAAEKKTTAMQNVLYADSYTDLGYAAEDVDAIYQAGSAGWVVQVTETGSQGEIVMMVGVSSNYQCTGISITESSETAGLGAIASQTSEKGESFRAQFVGVTSPVAVSKKGGSIDAISGATITSNAVCTGVTSALDACAALGGTAAYSAPAAQTAPAAMAAGTQGASAQPAATQTTPATAQTAPAATQTAPASGAMQTTAGYGYAG